MSFRICVLDLEFAQEALDYLRALPSADNEAFPYHLIVTNSGTLDASVIPTGVATLQFTERVSTQTLDEVCCLWAATSEPQGVLIDDLFDSARDPVQSEPEIAIWYQPLKSLNSLSPTSDDFQSKLAHMSSQLTYVESPFVRGLIRQHIRKVECHARLLQDSTLGLPLNAGGTHTYDLSSMVQGLKSLSPDVEAMEYLAQQELDLSEIEGIYQRIRVAANTFRESIEQDRAPNLFLYMLAVFKLLSLEAESSRRLQFLMRYLETAASCILIEKAKLTYEHSRLRFRYDVAERLDIKSRNISGIGPLLRSLTKLKILDATQYAYFQQLVSTRNTLSETHGFGHASHHSRFDEIEDAVFNWVRHQMSKAATKTSEQYEASILNLNTTQPLTKLLKAQLQR